MRKIVLLCVLLCGPALLFASDTELARLLKTLPGVVSIKKTPHDTLFREQYEIEFRQPVDHHAPASASFRQRVFLSHVDAAQPMILETEGYAVRGARTRELTRYLRCNQVIVEHRYFGGSKPDSIVWKYLTLKQSADDLHAVTQALKTIYHGKWISSGTSKGGQTTLLYRYYYPDDVDASVPYVAPVNLAQEDPRPIAFLKTVGTAECRQRIFEVQMAILKSPELAVAKLEALGKDRAMTFPLGLRMTMEYVVLEYPFAFWQYGARCEKIPPATTPAESLFSYVAGVVGLQLYSADGIRYFAPFQYQAYTELGYYGYDVTEFKPFLEAVRDPSNRIFAPQDAEITYNCTTMQEINRWLQNKGDRILYIYGENDPWSATAIVLTGKADALKVVQPGGHHGTRIATLAPGQQELVFSALERWLGVTIAR